MSTLQISPGTPSSEVELSPTQRERMISALAAEQRRTHPRAMFCFCGSDADLLEAYQRLRATEPAAPEASTAVAHRELADLEPEA